MLTYKFRATTFFDFFAKEYFTSGYFEDNAKANNPCVITELQLRKSRISHISGDPSAPGKRDKEGGYVLQ